MIFLTAFLWGTGLSLGLCVGLVAWVFLKAAAYKILGIDVQWEMMRAYERECLGALQSRNDLTESTNVRLERIADAIEREN